MIPALLLAASSLIGSSQSSGRVPADMPKDFPHPPLFKLADGHVSIRFTARIQQGHFTSVVCLEPTKANADWLMDHAVKKAQLTLRDENQAGEFEIRFCNMSFTDEYPATYSFWRPINTGVGK